MIKDKKFIAVPSARGENKPVVMRRFIIKMLLKIKILKKIKIYKMCGCGERLSEWFIKDKDEHILWLPTNNYMVCHICKKLSQHKNHGGEYKIGWFWENGA